MYMYMYTYKVSILRKYTCLVYYICIIITKGGLPAPHGGAGALPVALSAAGSIA